MTLIGNQSLQIGSADFGTVEPASTKDLSITLWNATDETLEIFGVTFYRDDWTTEETAGIWTWQGTAFSFQLAAGGSAPLSIVRFTPAGEQFYLTHAAFSWGRPGAALAERFNKWVQFQGTGAETPTVALSVQPTLLHFPDTLYTSESDTQDVVVANVSAGTALPVPIVISAITPATNYAITNTPSLPLTLQIGESITLKVKFDPTTSGDLSSNQAVTITSDAPSSPDYVTANAYAYITAIETVAGFDVDTLLAFAFGPTPTVALKEVDESDLDCEEIQYMIKTLNFGIIGNDKTLTDIFFKYEDLGVATVALKAESKITNTQAVISQQKSVSIGTSGADERALQAKANEYTIDGEMIVVTLYKAASSGPFSLIEFYYKYMLERKVLGTRNYTRVTTGTSIVDLAESCLVAFVNEDTRATAVRRADGLSLNCEEDAYFDKLTDFALDGIEKALMRMWLKCEDLGEATVILSITTPHGSPDNVSNTFGGDADEDIVNVPLDVIFSGELVNIRITREADAGPLSIARYVAKIEPRGELVEE
jgi:hypothetical protein